MGYAEVIILPKQSIIKWKYLKSTMHLYGLIPPGHGKFMEIPGMVQGSVENFCRNHIYTISISM